MITRSFTLLLLFLTQFVFGQNRIHISNHSIDMARVKGFLYGDSLVLVGHFESDQKDSLFMNVLDLNTHQLSHVSLSFSSNGESFKPLVDDNYNLIWPVLRSVNHVDFYKFDRGLNLTDSGSYVSSSRELSLDHGITSGSLVFQKLRFFESGLGYGEIYLKLDAQLNILDSIYWHSAPVPKHSIGILEHAGRAFCYTLDQVIDSTFTLETVCRKIDLGTMKVEDSAAFVSTTDFYPSSNQQISGVFGGIGWDTPGKTVFANLRSIDRHIPHIGYNNRNAFLLKKTWDGYDIAEFVLDRPDTNEITDFDGVKRYSENLHFTYVLPFYGDGAGSFEEFSFGDFPTLVDLYLFDNYIGVRKRYTVFTGEYLRWEDLIVDPDNDRAFVLIGAYDFNDSLKGKVRDLEVYEINGIDQFLSISEEVDQDLSLQAYPNPTRGKITVDVPEKLGPGTLQIFSSEGRVIRYMEVGEHRENQKVSFNLTDQPPGQYFVQFVDKQGVGSTLPLLVIE